METVSLLVSVSSSKQRSYLSSLFLFFFAAMSEFRTAFERTTRRDPDSSWFFLFFQMTTTSKMPTKTDIKTGIKMMGEEGGTTSVGTMGEEEMSEEETRQKRSTESPTRFYTLNDQCFEQIENGHLSWT